MRSGAERRYNALPTDSTSYNFRLLPKAFGISINILHAKHCTATEDDDGAVCPAIADINSLLRLYPVIRGFHMYTYMGEGRDMRRGEGRERRE